MREKKVLTHIIFCSVSAITPDSNEFLDVLSARIDQLAVSYSEPGLWKVVFTIAVFVNVDCRAEQSIISNSKI